MAPTTVFDTAALDMISELEKAAVCDVVSDLIKEQVSVSAPDDFWQMASRDLTLRNFTRSAAEAKFIYNACHQQNKSLPNVQSYVQNSKRQAVRQREGLMRGMQDPEKWPQAPPDPMQLGGEERRSAQQMATAALAAMQEPGEQQQGGESSGVSWNLPVRDSKKPQ